MSRVEFRVLMILTDLLMDGVIFIMGRDLLFTCGGKGESLGQRGSGTPRFGLRTAGGQEIANGQRGNEGAEH
jgi:hypothetical protein